MGVMRGWIDEREGLQYPELRLVPVLGEHVHGQWPVACETLLGLGLQLGELFGVCISLGVEGFESVEG